jgi:hypothetical protein
MRARAAVTASSSHSSLVKTAVSTSCSPASAAALHEFRPPWWLRLITSIPGLRNIPARILAFGPRRERLREALPLA